MWLCKHLGRSGKSSHLRISVSALQFFVVHFRAPSWGANRPGIDSQGVNGYDNDTPTVFNCWRPPVCCPVSKLEQRSGVAFLDAFPDKLFHFSGFAGRVPDGGYYIRVGFSVQLYGNKHRVFPIPLLFRLSISY